MQGGKYGNKNQEGGWVTPNPKQNRTQPQTFDITKIKAPIVSNSGFYVRTGNYFISFVYSQHKEKWYWDLEHTLKVS